MTALEMSALTFAPFILIFLVAAYALPPRSLLGFKLSVFGLVGILVCALGWAVYGAVWVSRHLCY